MRRDINIIIPAMLILLSGCSEYKLFSSREGTLVQQVSEAAFTVTFCGSAFMAQNEVDKYVLQRASELTLSKGFTHFMILSREDASEVCALKDVSAAASGGGQAQKAGKTEVFYRPNMKLKIECYRGSIPKDAIDAQQFLDENFPGLRFSK